MILYEPIVMLDVKYGCISEKTDYGLEEKRSQQNSLILTNHFIPQSRTDFFLLSCCFLGNDNSNNNEKAAP